MLGWTDRAGTGASLPRVGTLESIRVFCIFAREGLGREVHGTTGIGALLAGALLAMAGGPMPVVPGSEAMASSAAWRKAAARLGD